jgi:transposase-like protein
VVVRFTAPETGGVRAPRFVLERVLAFEARLEALADPGHRFGPGAAFRQRHVRAALERHIAETLLASLRIVPEPSRAELSRQAAAARLVLVQRVGGGVALADAARAEGIGEREILRILRRQARASLYLDRMVAPMLKPSDVELRALHRSVQTPFLDRPFDEVAPELRRWYVGRRLAAALTAFYRNARSRVSITVIGP